MSEFNLSNDQYNEILRLATFYQREGMKCRDSKAYLAGCIMLGSASEAILMAFTVSYIDEVMVSQKASKRSGQLKPIMEWTLSELLTVAKNCNWLPSGLSPDEEWKNAKAKIGDYGNVLRQIRNLVHPARYMLDFTRKRITKRYVDSCFEIIDDVVDYLMIKIGQSLQTAIDEDEKISK